MGGFLRLWQKREGVLFAGIRILEAEWTNPLWLFFCTTLVSFKGLFGAFQRRGGNEYQQYYNLIWSSGLLLRQTEAVCLCTLRNSGACLCPCFTNLVHLHWGWNISRKVRHEVCISISYKGP